MSTRPRDQRKKRAAAGSDAIARAVSEGASKASRGARRLNERLAPKRYRSPAAKARASATTRPSVCARRASRTRSRAVAASPPASTSVSVRPVRAGSRAASTPPVHPSPDALPARMSARGGAAVPGAERVEAEPRQEREGERREQQPARGRPHPAEDGSRGQDAVERRVRAEGQAGRERRHDREEDRAPARAGERERRERQGQEAEVGRALDEAGASRRPPQRSPEPERVEEGQQPHGRQREAGRELGSD